MFNNSQPNEVSYFVRSLDTGHGDLQTLSASSLKRLPTSKPRLQITQGEGEDEEDVAEEPQSDPFSAMILWSQSSAQERPHAVSKFPSVRPADSLQVAPRDLTPSESILFIAVDKPSTITLRSVADRQGDRFRITQRREAVVIECPIGGHFLEDDGKGKRSKKADKARPAELRCVGDEEVAHFEARGVGVLKVGWRKHGGHQSVTGVVEGIEADDEAQADVSVDPLALVRRDMVSKTHTVPLRIQHDQIGMYTIGLTSVTDSLHNTYTPQGHSAEKVYHVIGRPSASLDCRAPKELLEGGKVSVDLLLDGEASREAPVSATWSFGSADGKIQRGDTVQLSKRKTSIELDQPGVLRLEELSGACTGSILEPSTCSIVLVPKPTVDLQVETLHERSMVFGLSAAFEFTGAAPFRVEWTEQRNGGRPVKQSRKFNGHHGEITLQPEDEGQYTYVSPDYNPSRQMLTRAGLPECQRCQVLGSPDFSSTNPADRAPPGQRGHCRPRIRRRQAPQAVLVLGQRGVVRGGRQRSCADEAQVPQGVGWQVRGSGTDAQCGPQRRHCPATTISVRRWECRSGQIQHRFDQRGG